MKSIVLKNTFVYFFIVIRQQAISRPTQPLQQIPQNTAAAQRASVRQVRLLLYCIPYSLFFHTQMYNSLMYLCFRMAIKLHCLSLLLLLVCSSRAKRPHCPKSATDCNECIRSGPDCAWCTAPDSDIRCQTSKGLRRAGCPKDHIYNPQGGVQVAKNDSR